MDGQVREIRERWFLARTHGFELSTAGFDQLERDTIIEYRWWTIDALRNQLDRVIPADLADRLEKLLQDGLPAHPLDITPRPIQKVRQSD
jgi:hypothetical protein